MTQLNHTPSQSWRVGHDDLKDALAHIASGVALISLWEGDTPQAIVVRSLIGLSVDPPRVLFNVPHQATAHEALLRQGQCSAFLLAQEDRPEVELFAAGAEAEARFRLSQWDLVDRHAPHFLNGLASFKLDIEQRIGAASNTIFIAQIRSVDTRYGRPLIAFDRGLHALGDG